MIFLSYCWSNEKIADLIDQYFSNNGIKVKRDKRDLKYKQSIKEFMKTIRDAEYVIMIISKEYLESKNCMYEMLEFVKNKNFEDKIIPIITKESKIFDANSKINYLKYWTNKKNDLKEALKDVSAENSIPIIQEIKEYDNVESQILDFLNIISDMNNIIIYNDLFNDIHYDTIKNYIKLDSIIPKKFILNINLDKKSKLSTSEIISFISEKSSELEVVYLKEQLMSLKIDLYNKKDDLTESLYNKFPVHNFEKVVIFLYEEAYYFIAKRKISEYNSKALMWWKPMNDGYTDNLKNAGFYSIEDIHFFTKHWFYKDQLAIKCSEVDKLNISVIPLNSSYSKYLIENKENFIGNILYDGKRYF